MTATFISPTLRAKQSSFILIDWIVTLFISTLPNIIWRQSTGQEQAWLFGAKLALLVLMLAVSLVRNALKGLRLYLTVLLMLILAEWATGWIAGTSQ